MESQNNNVIKSVNDNSYFEDNLYKKYKNLSQQCYKIFRNDETKKDAYHTWLFVGGTDMFSSFEVLATARTYVNHFEEDIRGMWTHPKPEEFSNNQYLHNYFQRYIFNLSKPNQNIKAILDSWCEIEKLNPESLVYLVGAEDILNENSFAQSNLNNYLENLTQLILKGLNLRNNKGYVFLQKHWAVKDNQKNSKIKIFNDLVDAAIDDLYKENPNYLERICVINHYINTDSNVFQDKCLNDNDDLNKYGHLEIGKQLATFTYKKTKDKYGNFIDINWGGKQKINPNINSYEVDLFADLQNSIVSYDENNALVIKDLNFQIKDFITKKLPEIKVINNNGLTNLQVEIDSNLGDIDLYYWIYFSDSKVSIEQNITSKNSQFIIKNVLPNKNYLLKIFTKDGNQFPTIYGNTANNEVSTKIIKDYKIKNFYQKIQSQKSINWIVIGDSIPHAAAWTIGWDGWPVNFIRSLKQNFQREDDILINLSTSGNTTIDEINNFNERLKKYYPDVLIIAIGTNDVKNNKINDIEYVDNINYFIEQAKLINPDVIIFLSSILLSFGWMDYKKVEMFNNQLEKIASNKSNVIYLNLNCILKKMLYERPYYYSKEENLFYAKDGLHFSKEGQLFISKLYLKSFGFDLNDSELEYISYIPITTKKYENEKVVADIKTCNNEISVSFNQIKSLKEISTIVIEFKNIDTNQIYKKVIERASNQCEVWFNVDDCNKIEILVYGYSKDKPIRYLFNAIKQQ